MYDEPGVEVAPASSGNPNYCTWTDPDDGKVYEFRYTIPLDGREFMEWRELRHEAQYGEEHWWKLPPFADVPKSVSTFFFGPLIDVDESK
jgi:hypothetical protein